MIMFDISKFLNEEKTQINLPVPIGGTVWKMRLGCDDACRRWTNRGLRPTALKCEMRSVCHTIAREPAEIKVTEKNIFNILTYWGEVYFATQEEAEKETKKVATDNIATMRQYGFSITDHGYIGEDNKLTWEKHKDYVFLEYDEVGEAVYDEVTRYHCPACGKGNYKKPPRFCPNCGKELSTAN